MFSHWSVYVFIKSKFTKTCFVPLHPINDLIDQTTYTLHVISASISISSILLKCDAYL